MSMVFAGFMGAARKDRELREEREANEDLFNKKFEQEKILKNMTLYNKQKLEDAALGKDVDMLISQYNLPATARGTLVEYLGTYKAGEVGKMISEGQLNFDDMVSAGAGSVGGATVTGDAAAAISDDPVLMLARTMYAEAENQGMDGMMDVGSVIRNRVAAGGAYGDGVIGVITKPGQFSPWNSVTGYAKGEQGRNMNFTPPPEVMSAAQKIYSGDYTDNTKGATHFVNKNISNPSWANDASYKRGDHWFGNADGGPINGNTGPLGDTAFGGEENDNLEATGGQDFSFGTPVDDTSTPVGGVGLSYGNTLNKTQDQQTEEALGGYTAPDKPEMPEIRTNNRGFVSNAVDMSKLSGKSVAEIDAFIEVNNGNFRPNQAATIERLRERAAAEEESSVEWRDTSKVRIGNYASFARTAELAGEDTLAAEIRRIGGTMERQSDKLTDDKFTITYEDETGTPVTVSATQTQSGGYLPHIGGAELIPANKVTKAYTVEEAGAAETALARFNEKSLQPVREAKTDLATMVESAMDLDQLVEKNEAILTFVGGSGSALLQRMSAEFSAINVMLEGGATESEITEYIDKTANTVAGNAQDYAAFLSGVTRFAFKYAAIGLGQDGKGLSDNDFKQAFKIVQQGSSYDTFSKGLRTLTKQSINDVNRIVQSASTDAAVIQFRDFHPKFSHQIDPVLSDVETYLSDVGLSDGIDWADSAPAVQKATETPETAVEPTTIRSDKINEVLGQPTFDAAAEIYKQRKTPEEKQRFKNTIKNNWNLTDAEADAVMQKMTGGQ